MDNIDLVFFNDPFGENLEEGITTLSWEEIIKKFSTHEIRKNKNGACFIPATFKDPDDWVLTKKLSIKQKKQTYRNDDNIESISLAVIDLDNEGAIEKAKDFYGDFEHIIYSTHNYSTQTPYKFRMILKLAEPIPKEEWANVFQHMVAGVDADKKCGNFSRIYYMPSHHPENDLKPVFEYKKGKEITADDILRIGEPHITEEQKQKLEVGFNTNIQTNFSNSNSALKNKIRLYENPSYDMEEFYQRHQNDISDYMLEDSRHDLAMKTILREFMIFGYNVKIVPLIVMIAKVAAQYGNGERNIYTGNTVDEIPELIHSAIMKANIPNIETLRVEELNNLIDEGLEKGLTEQFEEKGYDYTKSHKLLELMEQKQKEIKAFQRKEEVDYNKMKEAHKQHIFNHLMSNYEPIDLLINILREKTCTVKQGIHFCLKLHQNFLTYKKDSEIKTKMIQYEKDIVDSYKRILKFESKMVRPVQYKNEVIRNIKASKKGHKQEETYGLP